MNRTRCALSPGPSHLRSSYLRGFQLFLYIHPFAFTSRINNILSFYSERLFRNDPNPFISDDDFCTTMPLMASFTNFALCIGAYYSRDDFNADAASKLYENGKKYVQSGALPVDASVHAMIVFLWVYLLFASGLKVRGPSILSSDVKNQVHHLKYVV